MARMDDGFKTLISLSGNTEIALWEKEVTPPGVRGGGPIDTTGMHNTAWRTQSPKQLKTTSISPTLVAYDPVLFEEIAALENINQRIELTFPDDTILQFYGYVETFELNPVMEGRQPTAITKLVPTNVCDIDGSEFPPCLLTPGDYGFGVYGVGNYLG